MRTSSEVNLISTALIVAQSKIKHATKDAKNPHFKNDYATLEAVIDASKSALLEQDIAVLQGMNGDVLTTRLQHKSGQFFESDVRLVLSKQDMQGLGSAITYARRYSLAAMVNITQQDDDGNVASGRDTTPRRAVAGRPKALPTSSSGDDDF